ncbi:MAG TPA: flagellin [bacterium]|nr:flagellin [bacterium]
MSVVNTNISGLIGLNNLRLTNLGLQTSLERLSSGLRINHAADDPSGLAIAKGMEAQIGGIRTAVQNAEDGINLIRTADGSLSETQDILLRMRDLAVRAANEATLTSADMTRLDNEFQSLKDELDRKSEAVTFNTKTLFNGTFSAGLVLQIGPDNMAGGVMQLSVFIPTLSASQIMLTVGIETTSVGAAQDAIDAVQSALNIISDLRANLGIQERRLGHIIDDLKAADINISAAKSRIYDADMAVEISEFTRLQILQQSGTAILAQANAQPQSVLQLLK